MKRVLLLTLILFSSVSFAGEVPVEISAKRVEGNVNKTVEAEGRVIVKYSDVTIEGDRALYDREKGILRVWGNVLIREGDLELHCKNLIYDLNTKRAVLERVEGKLSPTDMIKADRIERISEEEWIAYDGEYTPCPHKCPDWSVSSKKFKVLIGKSFSGKWVAFRVKEVPIVVSPYLSGPIRRKRESGFLTPRVGYIEKDGFVYKQPVYFVLGRSADLTLTLEKRTIDGRGFEGELRYVLGKKNSGDLDYYQLIKKENRSWKFSFFHNYNPSDYLYLKSNVDVVSSRRYYTDTTTFNVEEQTQLYTKSSVTGSKLWERAIFNVNAQYLRYLNGSTDTAYQQVPNVNFYLMDTKIPKLPVTFNLNSEVTYFYRKAGGSSYRLNAEPSLRYVKRLGTLKNTSKLSYLLTFYQIGGSRSIWQFKNETKTNKFFYYKKFSVSLNPEIAFFYRESEDQSSNPFFDSSDRLEGARELTPSLETFVYLQGKRLARFSVDSKYRVSNGWEEANWDFEISPAEWLNIRESGNYNLSVGEISFSNTYISAKAPFGLELWTNYYKQQNPEEITYLRWGTSFPINKYLSFSFQNRYDLRLNEDRERQYSLRVNRGCWNGILSYRWIKTYTNEINYQITLRINLLRLGSYGYQLTGTKVK
ncbi:LPS-assembly protein [Balnearium lithotrophicum]|uniref:LPS-assembly protein n=1 Tax=Balnearium lithotrophicum TaxID=223788 RepID=A0A521ADI8_9BACT|nr:LPS assembly protein LptD [Balnearium lithotrophicum]SMO32877.1 LPS-assembly protein [Balnearium lithotrophicum]